MFHASYLLHFVFVLVSNYSFIFQSKAIIFSILDENLCISLNTCIYVFYYVALCFSHQSPFTLWEIGINPVSEKRKFSFIDYILLHISGRNLNCFNENCDALHMYFVIFLKQLNLPLSINNKKFFAPSINIILLTIIIPFSAFIIYLSCYRYKILVQRCLIIPTSPSSHLFTFRCLNIDFVLVCFCHRPKYN